MTAATAINAARLLQHGRGAHTDADLEDLRHACDVLSDARTMIDRATGFALVVVGESWAKVYDDDGNESQVPTVTLRHRGSGNLLICSRDGFDAYVGACISQAERLRRLREG